MNRGCARPAGLKIVSLLAALVTLMGSPAAFGTGPADVVWLEPERFVVTPGATLRLDIAMASEFADGSAATSVVVGDLSGNLAGSPLIIAPPVDARFSATLPRPGVAVVVADLRFENRIIPTSEVEQYLRHVHATDEVNAAWTLSAAGNWRETRTLRLKTIIAVGEPEPGDRSWTTPQPRGLDIVCESVPAALTENGELVVRVYRDGQPAEAALVLALSRGGTREHAVVTDAEGRARVSLDARGAWLVRCTQIERTGKSDFPWKTDATVLTVETR